MIESNDPTTQELTMFEAKRPRSSGDAPAHSADAIPFAAMRERGEAGMVQRWVHHFFFPDEASAMAAADTAADNGWSIQALAEQPSPFPAWVLRVSRDTAVDIPQLDAARQELTRLAQAGGGTYAGWDVHPAPRHALAH